MYGMCVASKIIRGNYYVHSCLLQATDYGYMMTRFENIQSPKPYSILYDKQKCVLPAWVNLQVNLCQSCPFCRTWGEHVVYVNCSECQKQFLYTTCSPHVLSLEFSCIELVIQ